MHPSGLVPNCDVHKNPELSSFDVSLRHVVLDVLEYHAQGHEECDSKIIAEPKGGLPGT